MRSAGEILGAILILIGVLALSSTTGLFAFGFGELWRLSVALLVIGAGIWVLLRSGALGGRARQAWAPAPGWGGPSAGGRSRLIGELSVQGPLALAPSRYETFIGEVWVDLSAADVPEGETSLRVSSGIGGVRVLLPAGVGALVRGQTLIGDLELFGRQDEGFLHERVVVTDDYASSARRVRLEATSAIGNVAVRRVGGARPVEPSAGDG